MTYVKSITPTYDFVGTTDNVVHSSSESYMPYGIHNRYFRVNIPVTLYCYVAIASGQHSPTVTHAFVPGDIIRLAVTSASGAGAGRTCFRFKGLR